MEKGKLQEKSRSKTMKKKEFDIFERRSQTICSYLKCKKRRVSSRQKQKKWEALPTEKGLFNLLPLEVIYNVLQHIPLSSLGKLALSSKYFRGTILLYVYSKSGCKRIIPRIAQLPDSVDLDSKEYKEEAKKLQNHYKDIGIMLKRSTCLFSTKDRLSYVGKVLDQLRDSHVLICNELGSELAYSCYGIFLHTFIAGWEDEEKARSYEAIKGASLLEQRINQVMKTKNGTHGHFERYIRVFCKEIFLKKSNDDDKSFWLSQFLKPFPIFFRARLLFILYGPVNDDSEEIVWDSMLFATDTVQAGMKDLAEAVRLLHTNPKGLWSPDDVISIFDELTGLPSDWDMENVASFLKLCGDAMCCEVLGNKAINGRVPELACILYYLWQHGCRNAGDSDVKFKKEQDWFLALLKHLSKLIQTTKGLNDLVQQIFSVWEEHILDSVDDQITSNADSQQSLEEEERKLFRVSLHSISVLASALLTKAMRQKQS